jgi:hypothetical protein
MGQVTMMNLADLHAFLDGCPPPLHLLAWRHPPRTKVICRTNTRWMISTTCTRACAEPTASRSLSSDPIGRQWYLLSRFKRMQSLSGMSTGGSYATRIHFKF